MYIIILCVYPSYRGHSVYTELDHTLSDIAKKRSLSHPHLLTRDMHITPDFHGNRSPLADPTLRGMVGSERGMVDACALYYIYSVGSGYLMIIVLFRNNACTCVYVTYSDCIVTVHPKGAYLGF